MKQASDALVVKLVLTIMCIVLVIFIITARSISSGGSSNTRSESAFTNEYGTRTTKCAHSGCNNSVASSGDTNCCTIHSNRCLNCKAYIDEDAMYCMKCLKKALQKK